MMQRDHFRSHAEMARKNRLNHFSGDYRPVWKKLAYPIARALGAKWETLMALNNFHWLNVQRDRAARR